MYNNNNNNNDTFSEDSVSYRQRQQCQRKSNQNSTTNLFREASYNNNKPKNLIDQGTIESYKTHILNFIRNATPIAIGNLLQQPARWIIIYTAGHLGSTTLAGISLAQTFENASIYISIYALESAISTLCAQTWTAAKDKSLTGVHLQRGLILFGFMCIFPVAMTWYTASYTLGFLQEDKEIIHQAELYLRYQFPGFIALGIYTFLQVFLEAQGVMSALTFAIIISLPFNVLFNYILVWSELFSMGVSGISTALTLTSILILGTMVIYIIYIQGSEGWPKRNKFRHNNSIVIFQDWAPLIRLYLPSCFVQCCNACVQEITILVTSYLGKTELAAQAILLRTHLTIFAFGYAIQIVTANRIGNAIGSGSVMNTRRVVFSGALVATVIALFILCSLIISRDAYPYLFTKDQLVAQAITDVIPVFSVTQVINMFSALGTGTLAGLGYQKITAATMFVTYFILVGPLGYWAIASDWIQCSLGMLWAGTAVGHVLVTMAQLSYIGMLDWSMEIQKVHKRIRIDTSQQNQEHNNDNTIENEPSSLNQTTYYGSTALTHATTTS
ncbi:mate-domain-containing protein [Circinella umbellata]|nr:mate-domain-containing protein [Circinella umbellata]